MLLPQIPHGLFGLSGGKSGQGAQEQGGTQTGTHLALAVFKVLMGELPNILSSFSGADA
ncbi:hypothetical protein [Glutamicibacter mysorens]|uniref:hypothetical protein n=1 Tax=Glutamicibacter mysorens TaxID=257984 RepID=UPI0020C6AF04|nr:hypothetical protein [Glutamicibacter mysorens]UTM46993.1 hypothetical protein XH9_15875 [Glutamicibacter mysorens]